MKHVCLIGVAACAISAPAMAQTQAGVTTAPSEQSDAPTLAQDAASNSASADIVVTANRRSERLIDVPATVTAVTAEEVQNLKIFQATDVAPLSPGLVLDRGGQAGFYASASLRGVENTAGGTNPTVDFYYNDVPQDANYAIQAIYDIGQIEVLRGPQGTLRGRPTPSGAITITTRRPDLQEFGGFAQFTGTTTHGINGQAGVSIPLIADKLAIRVAGLVDQNDFNRVRSANSGLKPYSRTWSGRVTLLAQPTDTLQLIGTYQRLDVSNGYFNQVTGSGSPGLASQRVPAGFNGPVISSRDRLAVGEVLQTVRQKGDVATVQASLELPFNATLIYVGGYQHQDTAALVPIDLGNSVRNYDDRQFSGGPQNYYNSEVRLQSEAGRLFDYVLGAYYQKTDSITNYQVATPLFGAFGIVNPTSGPIDPAFNLAITGRFNARLYTKAVFGSVTLHAGSRIDLTAGARYNDIHGIQDSLQRSASATVTFPLAFPCAFARAANSRYGVPGFCETTTTVAPSSSTTDQRFKPLTYNAAAKFKISDDANIYASYGKSFRQGGSNIAGVQNLSNPAIAAISVLPPETSRSYEIGAKGAFLERRIRASVAAFQQDFDNLIVTINNVPYLGNTAIVNRNFIYAADARVRGLEGEISGNLTPNFDVTLTGAYAKGKFRNAQILCRDGNGDGVPDTLAVGSGTAGKTGEPGATNAAGNLTEAKPFAVCSSNGRTNAQPRFTATAQSEYRVPFGDNVAYVRGLLSYRGSAVSEQTGFTAKDFALFNLFAGVRIGDRADISVYSRNLFNANVQLSQVSTPYPTIAQGAYSTGYRESTSTLPREFGLSARVQWGSH